MKDFLATVGLLTICLLMGATPTLIGLRLSARKFRRAERAIVRREVCDLAAAEYPRWSNLSEP